MLLSSSKTRLFACLAAVALAVPAARAAAPDQGPGLNGPAAEPTQTLKPVDIARFYVAPDAPTELSWKLKPGAAPDLAYQITDYQHHPVTSGQATTNAGAVTTSVTLHPGFYELTFPSTHDVFGIVSLPAHQGSTDPFFGMDAVLSWLIHDNTVRDQMIQGLTRSGVAIARERVSWSHINGQPGKWDFNAVDQYQTLRDDYARNHLPILELFHDAPHWTHPHDSAGRFPVDLAATGQAWQTLGGQFRKYWAGLEIWNEPEGGAYGAGYPGEEYIPIIKTIAYTFQQAGYQTPLGGGVFMGEDPGDFHNTCARNGMLDQVNFVSFHTYHGPAELSHLVSRYRHWLKDFDKESMPLWISESGEPWTTGTARPTPADGYKSALGITMKAIEAKACGIARYFPFDYPFYEEGPRNFSMLGKDDTPLRNMAAYAQAIAALSGQAYLGDLKVDDPAVKLARVFGSGDQRVAVLYTGETSENAVVHLKVTGEVPDGHPGLRDVTIQGIDGRALAPSADGAIPIPDGLTYLRGPASAFAGLVETDTPNAKLCAIAQQQPPVPTEHSPIVLQFEPQALTALHRADGYLLQPAAAHDITIKVRVWNLSKQEHSVRLALHPPGTPLEGTGLLADPRAVPAGGSAEVSWTLDATKGLDIENYRFATVTDASGTLPAASPLAVPLMLEGTLDQYLARHPSVTRLPIDDLTRWNKNIAPHGTLTFAAPQPGHWQMHLVFSQKTDEWVYPQFALPKPPSKPVTAILVRARATHEGAVRLMTFRHGQPTYWTAQAIIPADGKWHAVLVPVKRLDPLADVNDVGTFNLAGQDAISVGMHNASKSNENTLEVSDLLLVTDPPGPRAP